MPYNFVDDPLAPNERKKDPNVEDAFERNNPSFFYLLTLVLKILLAKPANHVSPVPEEVIDFHGPRRIVFQTATLDIIVCIFSAGHPGPVNSTILIARGTSQVVSPGLGSVLCLTDWRRAGTQPRIFRAVWVRVGCLNAINFGTVAALLGSHPAGSV